MPGVHKVSMVRMCSNTLTNLRMYGSRHKGCRNAVDGRQVAIRMCGQVKIWRYESP
ncbi:MAG: hypothetical protein ABTA16_02885 [Niallia sp.]